MIQWSKPRFSHVMTTALLSLSLTGCHTMHATKDQHHTTTNPHTHEKTAHQLQQEAAIKSAQQALETSNTAQTQSTTTSNGKKFTSEDLIQAQTSFVFNSLKMLNTTETDKNKNIFISAPSISMALSMAYNGADGTTKQAMAKTLDVQGVDIDALNQQNHQLLNRLNTTKQDIQISMVNSMWASKEIPFEKSILNTITKDYKAYTEQVDFANANTPKKINQWVSEATKGKITKMVDDKLPENTAMFLLNAIYFKGIWTDAFKKENTKINTFTGLNGKKTQQPFMERHDNMQYFQNNDVQSVKLPYGKDQSMSMAIFLPKDVNQFVANLNPKSWSELQNAYYSMEGTLQLPKFKLDYNPSLKPMLEKLGMGVAFGTNANFTQFSKNVPLAISDVKHKAVIEVNEAGTEAAAVTSVEIMVTSMPMPKLTFDMTVNKPFVFVIQDNQTKSILFTGIVKQL